jgi:hypothetical protein
LQQQEDKQRAERQSFLLTTIPVTQQAAHEPGLDHGPGEDHTEGKILKINHFITNNNFIFIFNLQKRKMAADRPYIYMPPTRYSLPAFVRL